MDALAGIRIIDFSMGAAGPWSASMLGWMGAEVIKIESGRHPEIMRIILDLVTRQPQSPDKSLYFETVNSNKLGVTLDLTNPEARELAKRLVAVADVVVESFSPGTMDKYGLGYEELRAINPSLIMVSCSAAGATGPESHSLGLAPLFSAMGGLGHMTGYKDGPPSEIRFTIDMMVALHIAVPVLAALNHRQQTGQGQHIDLSSREAMTCLVGDSLLDYTMNGRVQSRSGNLDDIMAPHNCYRCRGVDSWVSIAVGNQEEWLALCKAMDKPELAQDKRFTDIISRWENQEELDRLVEQWTSKYSNYDVMNLLQSVGVAAVPSFDAENLFTDPHLAEQDFTQVVEHPEMGALVELKPPWELSETPARIVRHSPLFGEHNNYVLGELLGISKQKLEELVQQGVVA
jgi:benzylsuccinate CoA-transferase BbsF subunit